MKIIFLDVDGVLNNDKTADTIPVIRYIGLDQDKIDLLQKIVSATDAKIVLSSTWRRYTECFEYLIKRLGQDLSNKIIGRTPVLWKNRYDEIVHWLSEQNNITDFIVLDDLDDEDLEKFGDKFIKTLYTVGLTEELTDIAIKKLNSNHKNI